MSEVSKNSFGLIKSASKRLEGKLGRAFLATLIMVAPLLLCVFTIYASPVAVLFWGVFETGYIRYMKELMDGGNPKLSLLFSEFKTPWLEMFLGAVMVCMFVLGGVFLIVPAIILISFYSMALFVANHYKVHTIGEALNKSAKISNGNMTNMFACKTMYWAFYVIIIVSALLAVFGISTILETKLALAIVLLAVVYVVVTILWSVVTMFYHATNEMLFRELLIYAENEEKVEDKKIEIIEEEKIEEAVEEKVEVKEEKPVQKPKTTAKKPVTKTPSKPTKPATKSTTSKSKTTTTKKK